MPSWLCHKTDLQSRLSAAANSGLGQTRSYAEACPRTHPLRDGSAQRDTRSQQPACRSYAVALWSCAVVSISCCPRRFYPASHRPRPQRLAARTRQQQPLVVSTPLGMCALRAVLRSRLPELDPASWVVGFALPVLGSFTRRPLVWMRWSVHGGCGGILLRRRWSSVALFLRTFTRLLHPLAPLLSLRA